MLYAAKGSLHEQERGRLSAKAKQKPLRAVVLALCHHLTLRRGSCQEYRGINIKVHLTSISTLIWIV